MKILTVSQFGEQIKWSPHPSPSSFWALSQVTLRHSLCLQGQWLLQPNKDLSPSSSFFSGAPKGRGGEDGTHPREARLLTRPWVPSRSASSTPSGHVFTQLRLQLCHYLPLLSPVLFHMRPLSCQSHPGPGLACHARLLSRLSRVQLFATPGTIARQAPLSVGDSPGNNMEWVATPSSGGSSQPRD